MKTIVTMISSLIMGALMANSNFSPLQELGHLLINKRRFVYALGLYLAGFVFLMTGIIAGAIEATLQYEAQGFVFWSAMATLATSFGAAGVLFIIGGRLTLPTFLPRTPAVSPPASHTDWSALLEGALKIFSEMARPAPASAQAQSAPKSEQANPSAPSSYEAAPPPIHPQVHIKSEMTH